MNHIIHMIWYDLKATRNLLVVWGLLMAAQAILLAVGPDRIGADSVTRSVAWDIGMIVIRLCVSVAIAVALVQRDPLVGTTAFWRTRPASRLALMMSKLGTMLIVLVALPALAMGLLLVSLGLRPADAFTGATSLGAEQILAVGLTLPLAAVTANLATFAMVLAGSVFSVSLVGGAVLSLLAEQWPGVVGLPGRWGAVIAVGAIPVGVVLVLLNQFLTFRTKRSVAIIASALVFAAYGTRFPPGSPARVSPAVAVDRAILDPESVEVHVDPGTIEPRTASPAETGGSRQLMRISGLWTTTGEPDAVILEPASLASVVRLADRTEIHTRKSHLSWRTANSGITTPGDQPYRSIRAALGGGALVLPARQPGFEFFADLAEMPADVYQRSGGGTAGLDATVGLRAIRYVVKARVPLKPGASFTVPSRHVSVVEVSRSPVGASIVLRDATVEGAITFFRMPYYLVQNRAHRQAVFVTSETWRQYSATIGVTGRRLRVGNGRLDVALPPGEGERIGFDDQWLKDAELVWLVAEDLGVITRPLHVDGFSLHPNPREAK